MKYQTATLLLAGLATAAPVAQSTLPGPPTAADAARASSILSGIANGLKSSTIPGAEGIASILSGLGGGLANPSTRTGNVDVDSLVQNVEKRQAQSVRQQPPPPSAEDLALASNILSGLANGLKGSSIPGGASISSILQGLGSGLGQGTKVPTIKRQSRTQHPEHSEHHPPTPPTTADMERTSSILKGLSDGLKSAFPGSSGVSSILNGLSSGIQNGAKNAPANTIAAAPKVPTKRQTPPAFPGTPEAAKNVGQILSGLAQGISGSKLPANSDVAGILNSIAGGFTAAGSAPAS